MKPAESPKLLLFIFAYWHDARFKNKVGGPVKVYEMASNLTALGHDVHLFISKIGYPEKQTTAHVEAIPFIDLPLIRFPSFQLFLIFYFFVNLIRHGRPDILYVRIMWSFIPMLLGKLFSIPVILEINDSPHMAHEAIHHQLKRKLVQWIDAISMHFSDHILPVTERISHDLHHIDGISWDRMTVLPSGANTDLFHPMDKVTCRDRVGLLHTKKCVGFVGTLFRHQGIDVLIDSAPYILEHTTDVCFLIVGDGPMQTVWQERVTQEGLESHFIFTGQVPYEDVPIYSNTMDICVAPFLQEAGNRSPVKVFDYLACAKPVIMGDVADTSLVFKTSGAVLTVPIENPQALAEAIVQLLQNDVLRSEMGKSGREFVLSHFSRLKIAQTVERIMINLARVY